MRGCRVRLANLQSRQRFFLENTFSRYHSISLRKFDESFYEKNGAVLSPKPILSNFPRKQKSRRQHQADKGGLPIIESFPIGLE